MNPGPHIRDEDGRRTEGEKLHQQFNKIVTCPSCKQGNAIKGTFIKGSAGNADKDGRRYRRFVCRPSGGCGASIGVTEFIKLCDKQKLVMAKDISTNMDPLSQIPTTTVTENYKESRNSHIPNASRMMAIPIDNTHFTATYEESRIPTSESESELQYHNWETGNLQPVTSRIQKLQTRLQDESVQRQRLEARISALENLIQEAGLQAKSQVLNPILVNQKRNSNMMLDSASDQSEEMETILNPHTCSSRETDHDVELAMHESPSTTASGHSIPTHTYIDKGKRPAYSVVARGPALVQARFKSTTIGMAQEIPTQSNVQSSRHHPTNPVGKNDSRNSASTPLYLAGVPNRRLI
ncbi:hypothetical protein B9Z19DRAFT_1135115 [Tuber borchii]|uniref:Uncharacterized protein n=1 Tax=Tuber borchii TaxID=42251 RepID=A0A2T6ZDA3_TUBBO|nr:hypothetical protein B9Z19DRAFT_1135115 [Tuber borchii]